MFSVKRNIWIAAVVLILLVFNAEAKDVKMKDVELHPKFPVVEGKYQMTKEWAVTLPGKFNQRVEDGSLVFWRPGFTIWIVVWENGKNESKKQRYNSILKEASPNKYGEINAVSSRVLRYAYRLKESSDDKRVAAFYSFVIGDTGHVQMAIYFDKEEDVKWAKKLWESLKETK